MSLKERKEEIVAAVTAAKTSRALEIELRTQYLAVQGERLIKQFDQTELEADIEAGLKDDEEGNFVTIEEVKASLDATIARVEAEKLAKKSAIHA